MPDYRVDSLVDRQAVQADLEYLINALNQVKQNVLSINGQRIDLKSTSISSFTQATQELNKAIDATPAVTAKATAASQQLTKAQIEARLANQQRTAAIKDEIVASKAAAGSYNQLQSQLKSLASQYKALSEAEREGAIGKQLQADIATTNAQLKILDAGLGNFQRNVGNYNNSLGLLSKGIKGFGGLGVILAKSLGIDPEIAQGIQEVGRALRDVQHARELEEVGLEASGELYEQTERKIDATVAALDGEVVATETVIGSQAELTGSLETNAVAQTELATKTEVASVALEAEAGSAEIAETATKGFTASLSGGLGGALVIAIAAIAALVSVVKDYNEGLKNQEEAANELKTILGELSSAAKEYETLRNAAAQQELKDLAQQIDLRKASGVTALEALALDKQLAEAQLKTANDQAGRYNITKATLQSAKKDAEGASAALLAQENERQKILKQAATAEGQINNFVAQAHLKATEQLIEDYKKRAEATKTFYDFQEEIIKKQEEATNKIELAGTQTEKLNADDRRALILAEATIEADIIQSKNAIILSSEKSTLAQRLAALKSNQKEQLSVINATKNNVLNDPTKSDTEKQIATEKANADRVKTNSASAKAIFDVNESYRQRDLKAQTEYTNSVLAIDKARLQDSLTDRYTDLENNLAAIEQFGQDQNAILFSNEQLQLQKLGLTDEEKLAIEQKYNADVISNNIDTNNKLVAAQEKAVTDQIAALKYLHDKKLENSIDTSQIGTDTQATGVIVDATSKEAGKNAKQRAKIERDLQKELSDIDKQGEIDRIEILNNDLEQQKGLLELMGEDTTDIEEKITANKRKEAELRKGIVDAEIKYEEDKRNEFLDNVLTVENSMLEITQAIGDGRFQKQKDDAQRESDLLDQKTKREIDAVNASTSSEQDKAAAIAIIQARAQAEKQALDLKQRKADHDKAKFDKQIAILQIIAQIAIDIAKAQFGAAALAGVALIKLIATPIPAYKHGRGEGREELATVGDGGVSEYILRNRTGKIEKTPAVETLTHLMPKDRVFKNKEAMMKELAMSNLSNFIVTANGSITKNDIENMTDRLEGAIGEIKFQHTTITKAGWRTQNERLRDYDNWVEKYIKN